MLHDSFLTANHQAVAALETPNAAARSNIYVVNAFRFKFRSAPDIIMVVGIAAVDDNVTGSKEWDYGSQRCIHRGCWHHQPDSAGCRKLTDEVSQRRCPFCDGSFFQKRLHGFRVAGITDNSMTCTNQPLRHEGAHAAE